MAAGVRACREGCGQHLSWHRPRDGEPVDSIYHRTRAAKMECVPVEADDPSSGPILRSPGSIRCPQRVAPILRCCTGGGLVHAGLDQWLPELLTSEVDVLRLPSSADLLFRSIALSCTSANDWTVQPTEPNGRCCDVGTSLPEAWSCWTATLWLGGQ